MSPMSEALNGVASQRARNTDATPASFVRMSVVSLELMASLQISKSTYMVVAHFGGSRESLLAGDVEYGCGDFA